MIPMHIKHLVYDLYEKITVLLYPLLLSIFGLLGSEYGAGLMRLHHFALLHKELKSTLA